MLQRAGNPAQPLGPVDSLSEDRSLGKVREQAEREHILAVLQQTGGNRIQAARILGVSRKTLWKKLKHLGLSWPPELPPHDSG
jgi:transcriptional regulator of acetoin/glycerol metabolism